MAQENAINYELEQYTAEADDWKHRTVGAAKKSNWDVSKWVKQGSYGDEFYDWIYELVKIPPKGLNIQRDSDSDFNCLECAYPADNWAKRCGPICWRKFQKEMKEMAERIGIKPAPGRDKGAYLIRGKLTEPSPNDPDKHFIVGMYLGRLYPEVPNTEWKDSAYVLPINGRDYEIAKLQAERGFEPRWGGPYRLPPETPAARSERARRSAAPPPGPPVQPAYDTETYGVMIDAKSQGNWTRYMNSSCDPNLEAFTEQVGKIRVVVFKPRRKISRNEELCFYYGADFFKTHKIAKCLCRAYGAPHSPENKNDQTIDTKATQLPPGLSHLAPAPPGPALPHIDTTANDAEGSSRKKKRMNPPRAASANLFNKKRKNEEEPIAHRLVSRSETVDYTMYFSNNSDDDDDFGPRRPRKRARRDSPDEEEG